MLARRPFHDLVSALSRSSLIRAQLFYLDGEESEKCRQSIPWALSATIRGSHESELIYNTEESISSGEQIHTLALISVRFVVFDPIRYRGRS